jgi:hypothetical protein
LLRKRSDRNKKIALKDKGPLIEPAPVTFHYVLSRIQGRRGLARGTACSAIAALGDVKLEAAWTSGA